MSEPAPILPARESADNRSWRPFALTASNAVAALLLGSWIWPVTRSIWDQFDLALAITLNRSLDIGPWWQQLWAIFNIRQMDVLPALLIFMVLFYSIWGLKRPLQIRAAGLFATLALIVATIPLLNSAIVHAWIGYFRPSPTLAIEGLTRLSERVPGIEFKETSRLSFPGDHAFILSTFLLFFWYFGRAGLIWISTILTIVFVFPRMMSGAHWATDVIVGGFAPALIATSIMYATPLHQVIMSVLCPVIEAIANRLPERLLIPDKGYETHKKGGYLR